MKVGFVLRNDTESELLSLDFFLENLKLKCKAISG